MRVLFVICQEGEQMQIRPLEFPYLRMKDASLPAKMSLFENGVNYVWHNK